MQKNGFKNKISPKIGFQTPQINDKKIRLTKSKSSGNLFTKSSETFSKLKISPNSRHKKIKNLIISSVKIQ